MTCKYGKKIEFYGRFTTCKLSLQHTFSNPISQNPLQLQTVTIYHAPFSYSICAHRILNESKYLIKTNKLNIDVTSDML